ncbi:hypothetical protein H2200_001507 [Cladophialophora chaetospira]|uniref:Uncharacterized protein n=1 Tax=Cladophialophora chaetospira TaxID=386627 RepID=A0AA38XL01_9EURO|nr:hypothetical protein H2200_001507 [Cladophialophora chaetospira]
MDPPPKYNEVDPLPPGYSVIDPQLLAQSPSPASLLAIHMRISEMLTPLDIDQFAILFVEDLHRCILSAPKSQVQAFTNACTATLQTIKGHRIPFLSSSKARALRREQIATLLCIMDRCHDETASYMITYMPKRNWCAECQKSMKARYAAVRTEIKNENPSLIRPLWHISLLVTSLVLLI